MIPEYSFTTRPVCQESMVKGTAHHEMSSAFSRQISRAFTEIPRLTSQLPQAQGVKDGLGNAQSFFSSGGGGGGGGRSEAPHVTGSKTPPSIMAAMTGHMTT